MFICETDQKEILLHVLLMAVISVSWLVMYHYLPSKSKYSVVHVVTINSYNFIF